ncbi:uncharacterized protein LOC113005580 [Solenopsis invicta]|uniref:uncharacterized protein LOC113005580 n=1 Tax=Solenopsis invicta TaxID=13686 RepID=UPI00193DE762|nr:uncharacterized protein LOC113005580 [Solenopsis invicta]
MPDRLRGTKLRKHIATRCITLNLSEPDVTELANHLGHDKNIHMRHYRQSIPQIEAIKMSRLLNIAQGSVEENVDEDLQFNEQSSFEINKMENCIGEDSDDSIKETENSGAVKKRKKRSTSPYGSTKRIRWTEEECNVINTSFKQEISERRLPSRKQMVEAKMRNKCLSRRSVPQIRSWIHNQIFKKSKSRNNK